MSHRRPLYTHTYTYSVFSNMFIPLELLTVSKSNNAIAGNPAL